MKNKLKNPEWVSDLNEQYNLIKQSIVATNSAIGRYEENDDSVNKVVWKEFETKLTCSIIRKGSNTGEVQSFFKWAFDDKTVQVELFGAWLVFAKHLSEMDGLDEEQRKLARHIFESADSLY